MSDFVKIRPESVSKSRLHPTGGALGFGRVGRPLLIYGLNETAFAYIVKNNQIIVGQAFADEISISINLRDSYTVELALTPKRQAEDDIDYKGYLRASASTFDFWDNDLDAEYDDDI